VGVFFLAALFEKEQKNENGRSANYAASAGGLGNALRSVVWVRMARRSEQKKRPRPARSFLLPNAEYG
jgi:hypothetical protein